MTSSKFVTNGEIEAGEAQAFDRACRTGEGGVGVRIRGLRMQGVGSFAQQVSVDFGADQRRPVPDRGTHGIWEVDDPDAIVYAVRVGRRIRLPISAGWTPTCARNHPGWNWNSRCPGTTYLVRLQSRARTGQEAR